MKKIIVLLSNDSNTLNKELDVLLERHFVFSNEHNLPPKDFRKINWARTENDNIFLRFPENDYNVPLSQIEQVDKINGLIDESGEELILCTHSEVIFTAIRLAIAENKISHEDVEMRWYEKDYPVEVLDINEYGVVQHWPANLFNVMMNLTGQILRARKKK